jgi:dipeptidyl aminopeptidase/acylaminoacyl peptidase
MWALAALAGWLVAVAAPIGAQAQAQAESAAPSDALSALDVVTLRAVGNAVIAPDGQQIAYTLNVPRTPFEGKDGAAWNELHLMGRDGSSRAFVTGEVNVGGVAWLPDGSALSYLAKRDGDDHRALYVIARDGGESRRLLSLDAGIDGYAWSPDGSQVALLAEEAPDKAKKKLADQGFNQKVIEEGLENTHLWIATPAAIGAEQAEPRRIALDGTASALQWSPAGDRLAVALAPTPLIDDEYMKRQIHLIDVESGAVTATVDHAAKLGPVRFSPDGAQLAFLAGADIHDPADGRLMVVATATGGAPRDLLPGYPGQVESFAWVDAGSILYAGSLGTAREIGRVSLDGTVTPVVAPAGESGAGIWGDLSVAKDGTTAALTGQSPTHPDELFRLSLAGGTPARLTDSNPRLADIRFAPQEVVAYTARDGQSLEGVLIRPRDEQPGRRYPLIMVVHGGPEAHYSNGWLTGYSVPGQLAAARGFAVFYPNYRGSTGRGVAFSKLSQGDPAGKEFDDLVDGVDHLVAAGLVDRDRVGITGGSYGGYASAWGATYYSERFAASVMFVGISNKISKVGTSDIPNELNLVHDRHWPWEAWQLMLERSPIYHAEKGRTPLLILGGEEDTRVDPGQSMELFRILKTLGKTPVRLVRYPGEGHGNRRAASRLDYNLRLMRWMEHYLQGEGGAPPPPEVDYPRPAGADGEDGGVAGAGE